VRAGHGRIDVLVCNAWGGYMPYDRGARLVRAAVLAAVDGPLGRQPIPYPIDP
jgi:hypothetical protein